MGKYCEFCMGENTGMPEEYHKEVKLETHRCPHCSTRFCDGHWIESNECSCGGKQLERKWGYQAETKISDKE